MTFSKRLTLALLPALLVTGCATVPTESATPTPATFSACLVADSKGLIDGGVNESAYSAIKEAVVSLGIGKSEKVLSAKATTDSATAALKAMVAKNCNVIVASGAVLRVATIRVAKENPDTTFVLLDDTLPTPEGTQIASNLKRVNFEAGQASILAGYLAAANSKTGLVATFGSFDRPAVRAAMQGFEQGVQLFNADTDADVVVLGAEGANTPWTFLNNSSNKAAGQAMAKRFFDDGADVVYPAAGAAGLGAGLAAVGRADKFVIGVDRDWFMDTDNFAWRSKIIASTVKQVSRPVLEEIKRQFAAATGEHPATVDYVGTLSNGGVSLSEEQAVPFAAQFNSARNRLISGINSGEIATPKGSKN